MTIRIPALLIALALVLLAAVPPAGADSLASLPEPDYAATSRNTQLQPLPTTIAYLVYPTIGFPSIVGPGETLTPVVFLPDGGQTTDWRASLESARDLFVQTVPLTFQSMAFDAATATYRLSFGVPAGTPEDVYDLAIESAGIPNGAQRDVQPNAVRVLRPRQDYDFIHFTDTQIRDPTTRYPQKFEQVLAEIKLRDPAFSLYGGDLNFGSDYSREYPENWAILRAGANAVLCAPGNHDGYAWLSNTGQVFYDGLHIWRRTIGPTYGSIRYGNLRIIAANSHGGPPERRNALTFLCVNSGGDIETAQLAWIEAEARDATARGEEALLLIHHNPHPSIALVPNASAYPWQVSAVGAGDGVWNGAAARDELTRIFSEQTSMRWAFAGHTNHDWHKIETLGTGAAQHEFHYVNTTSPSNGGSPQEGYRVISVRGGKIAAIDYQSQQPSVPFPFGGNLAVTYLDPNDGQRSAVRVRVASALDGPVEVTLKVFVRPDARGYRTSAGFIREVGLADLGAYVVYARLTIPARGATDTTISPDPSGQGARPAIVGGVYATGQTAGGASRGGGGGSGCAAGGPGGTAALPTWLLVLGLFPLALARRTARRLKRITPPHGRR